MSLSDYSVISVVRAKARRLGFKDEILPSTRKDKKYMIVHEGKKIHFGQMGYEDFTKHKDKKRQTAFLKRNAGWKSRPKYSPAYLSYVLLW
jgi:hypothetical protein